MLSIYVFGLVLFCFVHCPPATATNEAEKPIWRLSIPMARICALDPNRVCKQSKCNKRYLSTVRICAVDRIDRRVINLRVWFCFVLYIVHPRPQPTKRRNQYGVCPYLWLEFVHSTLTEFANNRNAINGIYLRFGFVQSTG